MPVPLHRQRLVVLLLGLASACADQGPRRAPADIRSVTAGGVVTLDVGETKDLRVECLDQDGRVIRGADIAWSATNGSIANGPPGRLTVDAKGGRAVVRGIGEGSVPLLAGCMPQPELAYAIAAGYAYGALIETFVVEVRSAADTGWSIEGLSDTLHLRAPSADDSLGDVARLLTVRSGLGAGRALDPADFTWRSDDTSIASVEADGFVRARSAGVTALRVSRGTRELALPVRIDARASNGAWDVALVDAHWTQGAQDPEQRVPLIRNGRAAAVNVLAHATANAPASFVTLFVWNASGQLVWSQRVPLSPAVGSAPSFGAPSAQILVPRPVLRVAASWRLVRDGPSDGVAAAPDASAGNDAWPRTGVFRVAATSAPALHLRLVPLRLSGNDHATITISPEQRVFYDSIPRIRLPFGDVLISVESPVTIDARVPTSAELAANSGADDELWSTAIGAIDERRLASGAGRSAYWIGVLPKPTPDAATRYGGMAYVPLLASDAGPMSRTMIVRGHDWYSSPLSAGATVAHELGHTMGLRHAPCGNAQGTDPAYPIANGGVGSWVHWVSAWELGVATSAALIAPSAGDFMSYCSSGFVSPYHMRALIAWRDLEEASIALPVAVSRVLTVRGLVTSTEIELHRPVIREAERIDAASGEILVELLAADGGVLAKGYARLGRLSEGNATPFVAHVPVDSQWERAIASVRVTRGTLRTVRHVTPGA